MEENTAPPPLIRFGDYELDTRVGELRNGSGPIRLHRQPLRLLVLLLEHAGEPVSREQLRSALWPDHTFVDFEDALNHAVRRLREALGDSAEGPRFIETLPRFGYRFIAPVDAAAAPRHWPSYRIGPTAHGQSQPREQRGDAQATTGGTPALLPSPAVWVAVVIAVLVLTGLSYSLYRLVHRQPPAREPAMKITQLTTSGTALNPTISLDGKYVAYAREEQGQMSLWLCQVATGSNVQIVPPAAVKILPPEFSNDGNYVYYILTSKEHPRGVLCKVASLGGTPQMLFENLRALGNFSPDGKRLVFVRRVPEREEYDLIVANEDGSAEKLVRTFHLPEWLYTQPAWSPDGKTIALCVNTGSTEEEGYGRLVAVSAEDGEAKPIGKHVWHSMVPLAWLPDGSGLIAGASELTSPPPFPTQIYEISYPEGEARRITMDLDSYRGIGVTADAHSLVALKKEIHSNPIIASLDSSGHTVEEHVLAGRDGLFGLDWTPDGRILYTALTTSDLHLASMDARGGDRKQLTTFGVEGEWITEPTVCGDGRHIVARSNHGGAVGLVRMDPDGSNLVRLTAGGFDSAPSCSPDGRWVVFESLRQSKYHHTLWSISIDGGEATQLTAEVTGYPAVSPDGKWVACGYRLDPNKFDYKLAILPAGGGGFTKTFDVKGVPTRVEWTPDGQSLTYCTLEPFGITWSSGTTLSANLWSQPIGGGRPRQITNFDSGNVYSFAWSRDGKHLALVHGFRSNDVVMISNFRHRE